MNLKKYLIVSHKSPLDGLHAEEILELILALASMEYDISIVFAGDAVLQLDLPTNYFNKVSKSLLKALDAFKLFDLDNIYIINSNSNSNSNSNKLNNLDNLLGNFPKIKLINPVDLDRLIANHDIIFDF
jgi:sulfur relay (sulfurtransferase) DsrF/TusC family protein